MVEMHVEGLSLDPQTRKPIVILRQNDGKGLLPLWIGAMEAMTISLVLNGEELPRPLAHDLLLMVAKALNGTLTGVDIVDYKDGIYYAVLLLRGPAGLISVDCRPSDGIARLSRTAREAPAASPASGRVTSLLLYSWRSPLSPKRSAAGRVRWWGRKPRATRRQPLCPCFCPVGPVATVAAGLNRPGSSAEGPLLQQ